MLKPICLLLTGLLAAGNLFAQTEPDKSPVAKDADKPPTVTRARKPSTEQSPPPAVPARVRPRRQNRRTGKPQVDKNPPPFDLKNMDTSVKPEDDFYLYANGAWLKNTPIPPE